MGTVGPVMMAEEFESCMFAGLVLRLAVFPFVSLDLPVGVARVIMLVFKLNGGAFV